MVEIRQTARFTEWFDARRGDTVIVLLIGADKSTQGSDIAIAQAMAKEV